MILLIAPAWGFAGDLALETQGQLKAPAPPAPVQIPFSYTGELLANVSGGYKQGAVYDGLASLGLQVDLERAISWKGGTFLASAIYPHGGSLTNKFVRLPPWG